MEEVPASQPPRASTNVIPRKPLPSPNSAYVSIPQHENLSTRRTQKKKKRRCRDCVPKIAWAPELASVMLALAMLAAIVILLTTRQDKPLPSWPSVLGINSLVAIFSSVFKVALLYPITEGISELKWIWFAFSQPVSDFDRFDSASRGPWGAFKLLIKHPLNLFTSLGAAIMILSLGVDPFTQQVLRFYNCPIAINGATATIARTNNYSIGVDTALDPKMVAALYQGMLNPPANASVAMSNYCPSGNCTFPHSGNVAYSSLAICSSAKDISDTVKDSGSGTAGEDANWHYSLPSGLNVSYPGGLACWKPPQSSLIYAKDSLFEFEVLMMTTDCKNPFTTAGSHQCSIKPLAVRVSLSPCVIAYGNVSVSNSIFQEQAISSSMLPSTGGSYLSVGNSSSFPNTDCSGSKTRQGNKTSHTTVVNSAGDFSYRCPDPPCYSNGIDVLWYDPACIFTFGSDSTISLYIALGTIFSPGMGGTYLEIDTAAAWPAAAADSWIAPLWASGSANLSTVARTMESFTHSLNAVIRAEGDGLNTNVPARGVVLGNQTCVGVEWPWFALPCVLMFLTIVFLITTMVQSHRHIRRGGAEEGRRPWKSSTLPLLWCGLQDATKARYGRLDDVEDMKDCGDGTEVSLGRGDGGRWELGCRKLEVSVAVRERRPA